MPRRAVYFTIKMAVMGAKRGNAFQDWENVHEMTQKMGCGVLGLLLEIFIHWEVSNGTSHGCLSFRSSLAL